MLLFCIRYFILLYPKNIIFCFIMFSRFLSVTALAAFSSASPVVYQRDNITNPYVFTNPNGLNFTQLDPALPNITVFATGGTIAGSSSSNTATTGYTSGAVGILTLLEAVPEVLDIANVAGVQISNVGSPDITSSILLNLSKQINEVICKDDTMSGAVITHGTDTLEESAFFMDATVNCGKPIIIVGSMRPSTAISADGPFNLLEAVSVGINSDAVGRGAMVVLNDRIVSAYYATKTNANTMDTFKAVEMGNLGALISNTPYFFYPPVEPTGKIAYDISNVTEIPRVDILFSYQDMQNDTLYNAVSSGAKGIIIAGSGTGSVSTSFDYAIEDVINRFNIPVIQSTRVQNGEVPEFESETALRITSGYLNPQKSRVLLGILLALDKNITEIKDAFSRNAVS
ncbi:bc3f50b9-332b-4c8b-b272-0f414520cec8 [Sclerotinia trifoliorum]|uniref:asparaginase n=1 Tax=Sclerotinia trifoliorum TaxID=28548 RepID=A0A8H2ZMR6_9HELO|nr:bc3f50b9-332b-4c8b-b272-0f414520cec8 [Sclerotinia trifoliorum]